MFLHLLKYLDGFFWLSCPAAGIYGLPPVTSFKIYWKSVSLDIDWGNVKRIEHMNFGNWGDASQAAKGKAKLKFNNRICIERWSGLNRKKEMRHRASCCTLECRNIYKLFNQARWRVSVSVWNITSHCLRVAVLKQTWLAESCICSIRWSTCIADAASLPCNPHTIA